MSSIYRGGILGRIKWIFGGKIINSPSVTITCVVTPQPLPPPPHTHIHTKGLEFYTHTWHPHLPTHSQPHILTYISLPLDLLLFFFHTQTQTQTQTHKSLYLSLPNLSSLLVSQLASKILVIKLFSMVWLLPT